MLLWLSHHIGNVIIPTVTHSIFQRGRLKPPTSQDRSIVFVPQAASSLIWTAMTYLLYAESLDVHDRLGCPRLWGRPPQNHRAEVTSPWMLQTTSRKWRCLSCTGGYWRFEVVSSHPKHGSTWETSVQLGKFMTFHDCGGRLFLDISKSPNSPWCHMVLVKCGVLSVQRLRDLDLHEKKEVPKHRTEEKIKISDWANTGAICPKVLTMFCPMFWPQISVDLFTSVYPDEAAIASETVKSWRRSATWRKGILEGQWFWGSKLWGYWWILTKRRRLLAM